MAFWIVILLGTLLPPPTLAGAPDWVLGLRTAPLPDYPPGTKAVCLVDWGRTVIAESGEIKSRFRLAYRILAREGDRLAWIRLPFDPETRISDLKAWNLKGPGVVHEVGMKDAVETQLSAESGILFDDNRMLMLFIPQVEVDSIIAFEFERRHRPRILQDVWYFQQIYPVLSSRFELETPRNWEYRHRILNHAAFEPRQEGNVWVWELANLPAIPEEEGMPPRISLAATLAVSYFPAGGDVRGQPFASWDDVARWASQLMEPRFVPSPQISDTARRLASPQALGEFVQKQVRYVAIEIGIGGYQPHLASETFANRYGDCKDKVTLLRSLFRARELVLYPVLINTNRRGVVRDFPSPLNFNHMIAAIPLPEAADLEDSPSLLEHPQLGRLLLFDPTDDRTPFGQLPPPLQGTSALLVDSGRAHIIETPVASSSVNRRLLTGDFTISSNGKLLGKLLESAWGHVAELEREALQGDTHEAWMRRAENWIAGSLPGVVVRKMSVAGLDKPGSISQSHEIEAPYFAQEAGELLLFRPSLLKFSLPWPSSEQRSYPFQFRYLRTTGYYFEFQLPEGFAVDTLPEPVELVTPFATYRQKVTQGGTLLASTASLEIKTLSLPAEQIPELRAFFGRVQHADDALVVLKRLPQPPAATTPTAKPPP